MKKHYFFYALFLLSLFSFKIFSMESDNKEGIFNTLLLNMEKNSLNNHKADNFFEEAIDVDQFKYIASASDKAIFEKCLEIAPAKIKSIIKKEKNFNPERVKKRINRFLLVGEPGTGKSTMAKAVACHLGTCYFVPSGDLLSKHRHATSQRLNIIITSILKKPGKSVLFIDEIDKILENYSSENNDSGDTASTLWEKIDQNSLNPRFFLIGAANGSKKIPPQLQSRFRHKFVSLLNPTENQRKELILYNIYNYDIQVDKSIEEKIKLIVDKTISFVVRDIESLCDAAVDFAYEQDLPIITFECFEKAFEERENDDKYFVDFSFLLPDEERRHQETLKANQKNFDISQDLQLKLAELNACVQTHLMVTNLTHNPENKYRPENSKNTWDAIRFYHQSIFPERSEDHNKKLPARLETDKDAYKDQSCNVQ